MDLKAQGNKRYAEGNWAAAADLFTQALSLDPSLSVCLLNRAACWIKLYRWADGLADCETALQKPLSSNLQLKAYWRKAKCEQELGLPVLETAKAGLAINPDDSYLREILEASTPARAGETGDRIKGQVQIADTLPQKYRASVPSVKSASWSPPSRPVSYAALQSLMRQKHPEAKQFAYSINPEELIAAHKGIGIDPEEIDYFHRLISVYGGEHGKSLLAALKKCDRYNSAEFLADEKLAAAANSAVL